MGTVQWRISLVGLLLLTCGDFAFGDGYSDPSGFSFTYPDGWVPITRATMNDPNQKIPQEVKNHLAKNKVDFDTVAVMLLHVDRADALDNLNVVVAKQQIPVNDQSVKELFAMLPKQYAALGVKVDNLQVRVQKVGSHDALVVDCQSRHPGSSAPLRQRQVMIPGGGKTYIVTCSAKADRFAKSEPTFDKILASFKVPAPTTKK